MELTLHLNDREERLSVIKSEIGFGNVIHKEIVDKGHRNGAEIHNITDTGLIIVQNQRTKKVVTVMVARVGQLKRYAIPKSELKSVLRIARHNIDMGYNYI